MVKFNVKSILVKILIMIFAVCLVEGFFSIKLSNDYSKKALLNSINESSRKNVVLCSNVIGTWIEEKKNEIATYANNPIIKTMDWNKAEPYLKEEIKRKNNIYDIFFVSDTKGNYNTTSQRSPSNISDRAYFTQAMKGKIIMSDPMISKSTGNQVSVIAAPIYDTKSNIIGLMAGNVNLIKLSNIVEDFCNEYGGSYSYIVNKEGMIITYPEEDYIIKENISKESSRITKELIKVSGEMLSRKSGEVKYKYNGIESICYYNEIPNTNGWKLIFKMPIDYIEEPVEILSRQLINLGIIGLILSIILGVVIARGISTRIVGLKEVFKKAAEGDLTVDAVITSNDEIGEAAQSFNGMMKTIRKLTFNDPLSELPNKISFSDRLNLEISRADSQEKYPAIMIIEIVEFESINQLYCDDTGSKLLKAIASEIKDMIKEIEMICRLSEDKLAFLFVNIMYKKNMLLIAEKILNRLKTSWTIDNNKLYISVEMGISFYPDDGANSDSLQKNAYVALQRAKQVGRNSYQLFDAATSSELHEQIGLDNRLHQALENNEFILYYQPQVDSKTGEIVGAEALIRWMHPEKGIIPPVKFISIVEENELIIPLGYWILKTACLQNKRWQEEGYGRFPISVNISAIQLEQSSFINDIMEILELSKLEPQYLQIEITESITMRNVDYIMTILNSLRSIGIRIALDDFGTGYSSLNYLKSLPIDTLKIDKSFIDELPANSKDAAIVSTILAMGKNLDLAVITEGVETLEQLKLLNSIGCQVIQGYYYHKPLPAEDFAKLFEMV